jgi:undecaprenyl pyrophosphate synthase
MDNTKKHFESLQIFSMSRPPGIHLGIIPDGNRRWLKQSFPGGDSQKNFVIQHWIRKIDYLTETLWNHLTQKTLIPLIDPILTIQHLSIYFLTMDNLRRHDATLSTMESYLEELLFRIQSVHIHEIFIETFRLSESVSDSWKLMYPFLESLYNLPNLHIEIVGQYHCLPISFQSILQSLMKMIVNQFKLGLSILIQSLNQHTDNDSMCLFQEFLKGITIHSNDQAKNPMCQILWDDQPEREWSTLTIGFAYDPIQDFLLCSNPETRRKQPPIDLVIRTGGDHRTSGFFPFHTLYSEYIFHPKFFPDFTLEDLQKCIIEYQSRERRFGR